MTTLGYDRAHEFAPGGEDSKVYRLLDPLLEARHKEQKARYSVSVRIDSRRKPDDASRAPSAFLELASLRAMLLVHSESVPASASTTPSAPSARVNRPTTRRSHRRAASLRVNPSHLRCAYRCARQRTNRLHRGRNRLDAPRRAYALVAMLKDPGRTPLRSSRHVEQPCRRHRVPATCALACS
jgi:hypothetical protein